MSTFEIILIIVGSIFVLFLLLLIGTYLFGKKYFSLRGDFSNVVSHTVPSDYKDVISTKIVTKNENGYNLNGYFYKLDNDDKPKGLIIFFHGLGGGQNMYMPQIMYFVRNGYYLIAFDNEASGISEGKCIGSLGICNNDSKVILNFVKAFDEFKELPIYTLGHSWGGYTSICSTLHNVLPIKKSVSISGFHDLTSMSMFALPKPLFFLRPFIFLTYLIECGKTSFFTMSKAIKKNPNIKFLHIQGDKDNIVDNKVGSELLRKKTKGLCNIEIKMCEGWHHLPYLTKEGETYRDNMVYGKKVHNNGEILNDDELNVDEKKFNESNEELLKYILDFFEKD